MASRIISKLRYYLRLFLAGDIGVIWADVRRWTWSNERAYGLVRDLTVSFTPPPARIPIEVRPLDEELAREAFDTTGLDQTVRRELESRRRLWEEGLGTAYVAVDGEGRPCYVQWVIPGSEADHVDRFFRGSFVHLEPDELLLEAAWALPRARGQRIMSEAMSRITVAGARPEHRRAITFVGVDNEASLRGCYSAGYEVYLERTNSWRLGRRYATWRPATMPVASAAAPPERSTETS